MIFRLLLRLVYLYLALCTLPFRLAAGLIAAIVCRSGCGDDDGGNKEEAVAAADPSHVPKTDGRGVVRNRLKFFSGDSSYTREEVPAVATRRMSLPTLRRTEELVSPPSGKRFVYVRRRSVHIQVSRSFKDKLAAASGGGSGDISANIDHRLRRRRHKSEELRKNRTSALLFQQQGQETGTNSETVQTNHPNSSSTLPSVENRGNHGNKPCLKENGDSYIQVNLTSAAAAEAAATDAAVKLATNEETDKTAVDGEEDRLKRPQTMPLRSSTSPDFKDLSRSRTTSERAEENDLVMPLPFFPKTKKWKSCNTLPNGPSAGTASCKVAEATARSHKADCDRGASELLSDATKKTKNKVKKTTTTTTTTTTAKMNGKKAISPRKLKLLQEHRVRHQRSSSSETKRSNSASMS